MDKDQTIETAWLLLKDADKKISILENALKTIESLGVTFPDYDWADWNGGEAHLETTKIIAQFAKYELDKARIIRK